MLRSEQHDRTRQRIAGVAWRKKREKLGCLPGGSPKRDNGFMRSPDHLSAAAYTDTLRRGQTALRQLALVAVACSAALIVTRVGLMPSLLDQRRAILWVAQPIVALAIYSVVALTATRQATAQHELRASWVMRVGLITGTLWIANLAVETFAGLSGAAGIASSAPFLLGGIFAWTAAGYAIARRTGSVSQGIAVAVGSAMLCALLTILVGLVLMFTSPGQLAHDLVGDPDFARSHWTDLRAFAFANTFSNAFSHLLEAPMVALALSSVASAVGASHARLHLVGRVSR